VRGLIESLKRSFNVVSKQPFLFVWSSLLYVFMFLLFSLAAIGLFLLYFLFLSIFGQELNFESIATMGVLAIIGILVVFFINGLNMALAMAYNSGIKREKISLTRFYSYAVDRAPTSLGILLIRELLWLLLVGPFIALYIVYLEPYQYMDALLAIYGLFMTFIIHMLFTPSFILAGSFGTSIYSSIRLGFEFLRKRHVFFIGQYILFAFVWLMNFIPFLQIATIFFAYPLSYTSMIFMVKNSVKIPTDGDDD